jgi:hypothetical protein
MYYLLALHHSIAAAGSVSLIVKKTPAPTARACSKRCGNPEPILFQFYNNALQLIRFQLAILFRSRSDFGIRAGCRIRIRGSPGRIPRAPLQRV